MWVDICHMWVVTRDGGMLPWKCLARADAGMRNHCTSLPACPVSDLGYPLRHRSCSTIGQSILILCSHWLVYTQGSAQQPLPGSMKGTAVLPTGCVPAIISLNLTSGSGFIPSFVSENCVSADEQNAISVRDLNIDFVCVCLYLYLS